MISVSGKIWTEQKVNKNEFISETLITHKNSNFKKIVKSVNSINE